MTSADARRYCRLCYDADKWQLCILCSNAKRDIEPGAGSDDDDESNDSDDDSSNADSDDGASTINATMTDMSLNGGSSATGGVKIPSSGFTSYQATPSASRVPSSSATVASSSKIPETLASLSQGANSYARRGTESVTSEKATASKSAKVRAAVSLAEVVAIRNTLVLTTHAAQDEAHAGR